jgi:hypothetical protein
MAWNGLKLLRILFETLIYFYKSLIFDHIARTPESFKYSIVVRITGDLCRNVYCVECNLMEFCYRIRVIWYDDFRIVHESCIPST